MKYLKKCLGQGAVFFNEPLSKHCSIGIGGTARAFVLPEDVEKFKEVVSLICKKGDKFFVLGRGSNVLFDDNGFDGIVVSTSKISGVCCEDCGKIFVGAGKPVSSLVVELATKGFGGLDFMAGIPGSVGGAVYMNAGAFGHEIGEFVSSVSVFDGKSVFEIEGHQLNFSYRHSVFMEKKNLIILGVTLSLKKCNPAEILKCIYENLKRRELSQPGGRSAGCVFKRVDNVSAGKLIDDCGLKGTKIGGAEISNIHANFIINNGGATSRDVLDLIDLARIQVKEKYFKELELEIEYIK